MVILVYDSLICLSENWSVMMCESFRQQPMSSQFKNKLSLFLVQKFIKTVKILAN